MVAAILLVEVLAALGAKAFAIGLANRADGNFEQGIFAQQHSQINMGILGQDQSRIGFRTLVKGDAEHRGKMAKYFGRRDTRFVP